MTYFDLLTGRCGALIGFNIVVKHGGLMPAAQATELRPSFLECLITELEQRLGETLFEGLPRVKLTAAGMGLHLLTASDCDAIVGQRKELHAHSHRVVVPLVVSATAVFAQGFPSSQFRAQFLDVDLQFTGEDRFQDLNFNGVDAVICDDLPVTSPQEISRCLAGSTLLVASAGRTWPATAVARRRINVEYITMPGEHREPAVKVRDFVQSGQKTYRLKQDSGTFSLLGILLMVNGGGDPALLPHALVAGDIAAGSLVAWGALKGPRKLVWPFRPGRGHLSPALSSFTAFLQYHYGHDPAFTVFV